MILRRYGNLDYFLRMDIEEFLEMYRFAVEKEQEDQIRTQWNTMLPFMSLGWLKYTPFSEYVDRCTGRNIDMRPAEEIITEIMELHGKEGEG